MRVVSGSARGRRLIAPDGLDVRPTTDKVKESLFNIIQFDLPDSKVLDLFAGTGQLGIEALSRGAAEVTFVDSSAKSLDVVKKNLQTVGFLDVSEVVLSDAFGFLGRCRKKYDVVLLDPPYEKNLCDRAFELLPAILADDPVVVCETRSNEELPSALGSLTLQREYIYSAIKLSIYRAYSEE